MPLESTTHLLKLTFSPKFCNWSFVYAALSFAIKSKCYLYSTTAPPPSTIFTMASIMSTSQTLTSHNKACQQVSNSF